MHPRLTKAKLRLADIEQRNWPPLWVANGLPFVLHIMVGLILVPSVDFRDWLLPKPSDGLFLGLTVFFVTFGVLHGIRAVRGADCNEHSKATSDIQHTK